MTEQRKVGRPPMPPHRVQHGTEKGYMWHFRQTRKDPTHEACRPCLDAWAKRTARVRRQQKEKK